MFYSLKINLPKADGTWKSGLKVGDQLINSGFGDLSIRYRLTLQMSPSCGGIEGASDKLLNGIAISTVQNWFFLSFSA